MKPGSAVEIAGRVARGEQCPVELVEQTIRRIEEANPHLRAFLTVCPEVALAQAARLKQRLGRGEPVGPLAGVPVAFKDLTSTAGIRTTFGSRLYEHHVPEEDAVVVERLLAADAILVGKTNTPEFGYKGVTDNLLGPPCRNPRDLSRTPGGSSGGAAAAVAAGLVPLAEGTDGAGSIRIPASFCGVVGLKPSRGRIPRYPAPDAYYTLSHIGPLAGCVEDAALFLDVAAGFDPRDPLSLVCLHGADALRAAAPFQADALRAAAPFQADALRAAAPFQADALRAASSVAPFPADAPRAASSVAPFQADVPRAASSVAPFQADALRAASCPDEPAPFRAALSEGFLAAVRQVEALQGLRVAFSPCLGYAAVDPGVAAVVRSAVERFASLGCEVEEADPGGEDPEPLELDLWALTYAGRFASDLERFAPLMSPELVAIVRAGVELPGWRAARVSQLRTELWHRYRRFFERYHLLLTPTMPVVAFPLELQRPAFVEGRSVDTLFGWTPFTYPFNLTGLPAISVPCGVDSQGLPVGLQIAGGPWDDLGVLRAAAVFERSG